MASMFEVEFFFNLLPLTFNLLPFDHYPFTKLSFYFFIPSFFHYRLLVVDLGILIELFPILRTESVIIHL